MNALHLYAESPLSGQVLVDGEESFMTAAVSVRQENRTSAILISLVGNTKI
jgi:hypothetical protein